MPTANSTPTDKERIRRRQILVVSLSLLISIVYVAVFWLNQLFCTPVELYHRVWDTTDKYFYERKPMETWKQWEHKYDNQIKTQEDAEKYIKVMLKSLDDTFTCFLNSRDTSRQADAHDGFYSGVGMVMNSKTHPISVRRVMKGSPAQSAGVKPGDQILSVDGIDCSKIEATKIGDHTRERMYHQVHFMIGRSGQKLDIVMVPQKIPVSSTTAKILPGNIAYERIEAFSRKDLPSIVAHDFDTLKNCRALILDLRGNGGGGVDLCLEIASSMIDQAPLVSLRSRNPDGHYLTSRYILTKDSLEVEEELDGKVKMGPHHKRMDNVWGDKPIVVLVDEYTASAAEMVAAALGENHRARLVGERTFGKGIAQLYFPLPMSTCVGVTAGRYFTPAGHWPGDGKDLTDAQRATAKGKLRGIEPDVHVAADKELVYGEQHDNQLQYAQDLLREKKR
ncbi:MAG: PDZ domain-containing protein [Cyanobacteria bacterium SZAS TMP-1]|nr:PDZ domain-containing protein [Cyanobacteria bacterium SZAS TMP-1]